MFLVAFLVTCFAAVLGRASSAETFACSGVQVNPGDDLDAIVAADGKKQTTFCLQGSSYPVDNTVDLANGGGPGDSLVGLTGTTSPVGPAKSVEAPTKITNATNVSNLIQTGDNSLVKWVDVSGASGRYVGGTSLPCGKPSEGAEGCPIAGHGANIKNPSDSTGVIIRYVDTHHAKAMGINGGASVMDSEIRENAQDPEYVGFTASGMKADEEYTVVRSYVHDNLAHGLWCDQGCDPIATQANGWWIHHSVVVENSQKGIRAEFFPMVGEGVHSATPRAPRALIENSYILGNDDAGIIARDAQNVNIRNNVFGGVTLAGKTYPHNKPTKINGLAVTASDSGRSDRTDLWNVDITGNSLNGEGLSGCDLPPAVVTCSGNTP